MADEPQPEETAPPSKKSPLKLIMLIILAMAIGGGGAFGALQFLGSDGGETEDVEEASSGEESTRPGDIPQVGRIIDIDQFRVNLNESSGSYLLVQMSLEVVDDERIAEAITERMPLIRDRLVLLLSDLRREDINTIDGKEGLKDEIIGRLAPIVGEQNVRNVYFREFIMQIN
jgi:flagellar FliL protein